MPLVRFQVRNEFGLGRPELYGSVDEEEDPKAVLDGVSVAGYVGILRQLGDLAEFAAVVFHGLQENVMTTASRSQKLINRARRLEAALPPLEKAVLSQTSHLHFAYTAGCEWHLRVHKKENQFINSDLPTFVMDSYEECQDPPRLHLLDKFETGGSGSCLKRYSDPTFFRRASGNSIEEKDEKIQRYKKHKSRGKRKSLSRRSRAVSQIASMSNQTSGSYPVSLTDDWHATSETTSTVDMAFVSNIQEGFDVQDESDKLEQSDVKEQSDLREQFGTREFTHTQEASGIYEQSDMRDQSIEYPNGSSYIEYLPNHSPVTKAKASQSAEFCSRSIQETDTMGSYSNDQSGNDVCIVPWASLEAWGEKAENMGTNEQEYLPDDGPDTPNNNFGPDTPDRGMSHDSSFNRQEIQFDGEDITVETPRRNEVSGCDIKLESEKELETGGDQELIGISEIHSGRSEADDFVDALNTIESESETELENQTELFGAPFSKDVNHVTEVTYGSTSKVDKTEDVSDCSGNSEISEDVQYEHVTQRSDELHAAYEPHAISCIPDTEEDYFILLDPVPKKTILDEVNLQKSLDSQGFGSYENSDWHYSSGEVNIVTSPQSVEAIPGENILLEESIVFCPPLLEAVHAEKLLLEEAIATLPTLVNPSQNILTEEPRPICPSAEAISCEKINQEENSASIADAIPSEEIHHGESTTLSPSTSGDFTDESILQDEVFSTSLSLIEAIPGEELLHEDCNVISPSIAEDILSEKILLDSGIISPAAAEAIPDEKILQENCVAISSSMVETVHSKRVLVEEHTAVSTSVVEAIPAKNIILEESVAISPPMVGASPDEKILVEESVATCCPGHDDSIDTSQVCEPQESVSKSLCVQPVTIWTNGNLLGLAPSKPPVFAVPNSSNQDRVSSSEVEPIENTGSFQNLPCSSNDIVSAAPYSVSEKPGGYSQQISSGVFSLSHRLLMNGFSRRTEVTTEENKLYDTETIDEFLLSSPSSSPPLEHMKISFNPMNGSSGLKLNIPRDNSNTFASFQLVPGVSSLDEIAGESDNDTFCRSSPYISDDCPSDCSDLDSEQWVPEERPELKDHELYANVAEASLSASFLDLPCFDAVDISVPTRKQEICELEHLEKQLSISDPLETDSDETAALSDGLVHPNRSLPDANELDDEEAATCIPESKYQKFEAMSQQMNSSIYQLREIFREDDASDYNSSSSSLPCGVSLDSAIVFKKRYEESPIPYLIRPLINYAEDDGLDMYNEYIECLSDSEGFNDIFDEEDNEDYIILDPTDLSHPNTIETGIFMSYQSKIHRMLSAKLGLKRHYETINENLKMETSEEDEGTDQKDLKHFESSESEWELV